MKGNITMLSKQPIANLMPHYTDSRFKTPQTVWIAEGQKINNRDGTVSGAVYNYSDRIWGWSWKRCDTVSKSIRESLDPRSPAYIQEFLRQVLELPELHLLHVMAGFNLSTGFPYQIYGYIERA